MYTVLFAKFNCKILSEILHSVELSNKYRFPAGNFYDIFSISTFLSRVNVYIKNVIK